MHTHWTHPYSLNVKSKWWCTLVIPARVGRGRALWDCFSTRKQSQIAENTGETELVPRLSSSTRSPQRGSASPPKERWPSPCVPSITPLTVKHLNCRASGQPHPSQAHWPLRNPPTRCKPTLPHGSTRPRVSRAHRKEWEETRRHVFPASTSDSEYFSCLS